MNYYPNHSSRLPTPKTELCSHCHSYPKRWNSASNMSHPYCSKTCAEQARQASVKLSSDDCDMCHAYPKRWDEKRHTLRPYCSITCANKALNRPPANNPPAPGNCDHCHSYPKRWDDTRHKYHPYCSITCASKACGRNISKSAPAVSNDCIHCGIRPKYGNHPYCGKTCAQAAKAQPPQPRAQQTGFPPTGPPGWKFIGTVFGNFWGRQNTAVDPSQPSPQRSKKQHSEKQPRERILFYERANPHYGFTNFSPHTVKHNGKMYPTSEHLFQASKFLETRPDIAEKIRTASKFPRDAFTAARVHKAYQHPDWLKMNIAKMEIVVWLKFTQHADLKQELLDTGDAELVEDSAEDAFWGIGKDGKGKNELGKALERLRSQLRQ
ncbi:DUF1768-domain-containing protein, partial [Mycena crocata]